MTTAIDVRAFDPATDRAWASALLDRELAGSVQVRRGEALDTLDLPGLVAEGDGREIGLLFYRLDGEDCELFLLLATEPAVGIGTALVDALVARAAGRRRIWVVTTNRQPARAALLPTSGLRVVRAAARRGRRLATAPQARHPRRR